MGINLVFCIVASFLLRGLYVRRSISLSGKFHIGTVIPMLAVVTFLIIMVVKSSLALSLGLVGALSVIRFRTPIKEPEELVYLFLAIAIGLGYGAGQTFTTTIVFIVISLMVIFWLSRKTVYFESEYDLLVDWTGSKMEISDVVAKIEGHVSALDVLKFNASQVEKSAFFKVNLKEAKSIESIAKELSGADERISCTFYEARPLQ